MKKFISLFLLTCTAPLFAPPKDALRPALYEQCIKSICGENWETREEVVGNIKNPKGKNRIPTSEGKQTLDAEGQEAEKKILAKLDKLITQEKEEFLHKLELIQHFPTAEEAASLTAEQKIYITFMLFIASTPFNLISEMNSKTKTILLNQDKIKELAEKLGNPLFVDIIEEIEKTIYPYEFMEINSSPQEAEEFIKRNFPGKNFEAAVAALHQENTHLIHQLLSEYPDLPIGDAFKELDLPQNIFELQHLASQVIAVKNFLQLFQNPLLKTKIVKFDFSQLLEGYVAIVAPKDYVAQLQNRIRFLSEITTWVQPIMTFKFRESYALLPPSPDKKELLYQQALKILQEIVRKTALLFPGEKELYEEINQIKLVLPPTQQEYVHKIILSIETSRKQTTREKTPVVMQKFVSFDILEKLKETSSEDPNSNMQLLLPISYGILFEEKIDHSTPVDNSRGGKFVSVSLFTLASDHGAAILAHEVGHILETHRELLHQPENQQRYRELVSSLTGLHPERVTDSNEKSFHRETLHPGFYFGEDFADIFATKVYEKRKRINVGCSLLDSLKPMSLVNEDPTDPHSSAFFRVLHSEMVKQGKLPEVCTSYLHNFERNAIARALQNCWK